MGAEDRTWSGPARELGLPATEYLPCSFWLNTVRGEQVEVTLDDDWLEPSEFDQLSQLHASGDGQEKNFDLDVPLNDPRCLLPMSVNGPNTVSLGDLSRAKPSRARNESPFTAVLLTTFDEPDVEWALVDELNLRADTEVTLCMHAWTSLGSAPVSKAQQALREHFQDGEIILPGERCSQEDTNQREPGLREGSDSQTPPELHSVWASYGLTELEGWWHEREHWWSPSKWGCQNTDCRRMCASDLTPHEHGAVVIKVILAAGVTKPRLPAETLAPLMRVKLRHNQRWEVWLLPPPSAQKVEDLLLGYPDGTEAQAACDALMHWELLEVLESNVLIGSGRPLTSLDDTTGKLSAHEMLLCVSLQCDCTRKLERRQEVAPLGPLFGAVATNYGLLALEEAVSMFSTGAEIWPNDEEVRFCSISSGIGGLQEDWLHDLDSCVHRSCEKGYPVGPSLIVPPPPYDQYNSLSSADQRSLCAHTAPWHAPGREQVRTIHNKLLVRHMRNATSGAPYGWNYLGSHNLTQAAWGRLRHPGRDAIWTDNWELGVISGKARPAEGSSDQGSPFLHSPYPFGMSLTSFADEEREDNDDAWCGETGDEIGTNEAAEDWDEWQAKFQEHSLLHPKLLMFEHSGQLRVCIATANLRQQSWEFQAEAVWVRDFPFRKSAAHAHFDTNDMMADTTEVRSAILSVLGDPFARVLVHFLCRLLQNSPDRRERWIHRLLRYDFSSANARLVTSVPGSHPWIPTC